MPPLSELSDLGHEFLMVGDGTDVGPALQAHGGDDAVVSPM